MSSFTSRCIGSIVGSLVADSAAVPIHWVYNKEKLKTILRQHPVTEFLEQSYCPFYKLPTGKNSCYGDQTFCLLQSVVDKEGFDQQDYIRRLCDMFGENSDYEINIGHPVTRDDHPIPGPWRNGSIKDFLKNVETGEVNTGSLTDAQSDSFCKVAPLTALLAGETEHLLSCMENAIKVTQQNELALKCGLAATRLLEQCILGSSLEMSIQHVYDKCDDVVKGYIQKARDGKHKTHADFVQETGPSCALPGNFINSIHCLLTSNGDYRDTVVSTLTAGGCNCSRVCLVGACMGAVCGIDFIPKDWITKTTGGKQIVELAERVAYLRSLKN